MPFFTAGTKFMNENFSKNARLAKKLNFTVVSVELGNDTSYIGY